jgi:tetratricopeptide (TPR) repeat protein
VAVLRREGNLEGAIALVRQLVDKASDRHQTRFNLALILQEVKHFPEAEQEFHRLLPVKDGMFALAATYHLGRTRILGQYDQQKAVEAFLDYIARVPDDAKGLPTKAAACWRLGTAYEQLTQIDQARLAYQKAIDLDSKKRKS